MARSTVQILKRTYTEWSSHNAMRLAAAMAFYTMLSLAPLLVVALTTLSVFYKKDAEGKISERARMLVGDQGAAAIGEMLKTSSQHGGLTATIISFVVALVSASGLFISLQDAINTIWDVKPRPDAGWRAMARSRLVSVLILLAAGAVLMGSVVASTILAAIVKELPGWLKWLSMVGDIVVSLAIISAVFALIYKYLPDVKIGWKDVILGAVITSGLFLIGKYGLTLYFRFASVKPYGAAGSLAALLIFVYYSAALMFFGAEFTRVFAESGGKPIEPDEYAVKLNTADRAKAGEPHPDELQDAQAGATPSTRGAAGNRAPAGDRFAKPAATGSRRGYAAMGAGVALGALVGGVGALFWGGEERKMRTRAAQLALRDRLEEAERHMRRGGKVHDLLRRMNVNSRVDAVEDRVLDLARRAEIPRRSRSTTS